MGPDRVAVALLTQDQCKFCDDAKAILDELAVEFPLDVTLVDLGTVEGRSLAASGGVMFPPGVFVNGDAICYGRVSKRKLRKELARRSGGELGGLL